MFLSFTEADVKRALKAYKGVLSKYLGNRATLTEKDITHYLNHTVFAMFPDKYQIELSYWAFKLAVRQRLIYPSGDVPNTYIFADALNSDVL